FFDDVERKAQALNVPTWNSELYFEYHRGILTSQAETKKRNRESEVLLLNAEKFSTLAYLAGDQYPSEPLRDAWKKVVFNQFHDIAAGSGIAAIYSDAARDYDAVYHVAASALERSLKTLSASADTSGSGAAVIVFNPLSWTRSDVVNVEVQLPNGSPAAQVKV